MLLFSLCNYAYASKDGPESTFHQLVIKMNTNLQGIKLIKHDDELADSQVLVQVNEWVLTSIARFITHDNANLLSTLRRDITSLIPELAGSLGTVILDILQVTTLL